MKNTFVRAFVMTLAIVGFAATSFATKTPTKTASTAKVLSTTTGWSMPMCVPSDPSHCGMD